MTAATSANALVFSGWASFGWAPLASAAAACLVTWAFSRAGRFSGLGQDRAHGVQKFHVQPTSRLGGVGIFMGIWVAALLWGRQDSALSHHMLWFILASCPVWLGGLAEDLTHRVGPSLRLVLAMVSAAWLFGALGVGVVRTDVWLVDQLLDLPGATLCVSLLVVAGFTHSLNIIDGFHGLASGLTLIMLAALGAMALSVGDGLVLQMCAVSLAAAAGFFVWNWPRGGIFLGDAGAYLLGFWVVELGLLLVMRNPGISPMAPVVVGILPLIETLFSMYRRKVVRQHPVNHPDALHLHTLVYRRLVFRPSQHSSPAQVNAANAKVGLYFWLPALLFTVLAFVFMYSTWAQLLLMLVYLAMYIWLYKSLVRFKAPPFMRQR